MRSLFAALACLALSACGPSTADDPDAGPEDAHTTGPYTGATTAAWTKVADGLGNSFHCFASEGKVVYAGSGTKIALGIGNDAGSLAISHDQGQTWTATAMTENVSDVAVASGTVWVSTISDGLHKSTDQGATWTKVEVPNAGTTIFNTVEVHDGRLFVGIGPVVHFSDDGGATWTKVPTWGSSGNHITHIYKFEAVLVATAKGLLQYSEDNGATWTKRNEGLPFAPHITSAAVAGDALFVGTTEGIYKATLASGEFVRVNTMRGDVSSKQTAVFITASAGGVGDAQISLDLGETWLPFNDGLPHNRTSSQFHAVGDGLLAGDVNAIWRTKLY